VEMYYPNDCPVGGYGYLILLYFCVERQGQMRVKFERRQSFEEEFPERIIETIGQVSRWSENPLDKSYLLRVTPYNTICLCFLGLPPTSFTHLFPDLGGVCIEGGPGLSPLNNRIKNDNPKIRRHQRSPATDCRPN